MGDPVDLDAVANLVADLPHGPWHVDYFGDQGYPQQVCNDAAIIIADTHEGGTGPRPIPEFIAQARTLVPAMLRELRQLREAEAARLRDSEDSKPKVYGLEIEELPEGWEPVEAIVVVKCLRPVGDDYPFGLQTHATGDVSSWEAEGMLRWACRALTSDYCDDDDDDE